MVTDIRIAEFWQRLDALEVSLLTLERGTDREFVHPPKWTSIAPDDNARRMAALRPGMAVFGVLGRRVAVVDVDTKNGADPALVRSTLDGLGIVIYAEVLTPSGGWHFYVEGHPEAPSVHATEGKDGLTGLPGVEVLSHGTGAYLPGTTRQKYDGAGYVIIRDDLELLLDGGDPAGGEALAAFIAERRVSSGVDIEAGPPWDGTPPDKRQRAYLDAAVRNQTAEVAAMAPNTGRNKALYIAALKLGNYVAGAGLEQHLVVEALTEAARANGLLSDDGERSVAASIASGLRNGRAKPRAVPTAQGKQIEPAAAGSDPLRLLGALLADLATWHHLPDPSHVVAALAAAATRDAEGEPCWLLLVAPPSSGKTEAVRLLDRFVDDRLDEVTAAGLLGWTKGKDVRPSGVLARAGERALVTFGDLSTLLATADRGGRDHVFGLLRSAYDGHVFRDVSPPGRSTTGEKLHWSGRLTVVAAVTGAIDRSAAHNDQLGPRWVYVRLPERSTEQKRAAARLARAAGLAERRKDAASAAASLLDLARARLSDDVHPEVAQVIEDAALVTAWGRAAVPRNGYGRREIEGVPVIEEPMRLVQQLGALARGMAALGLPTEAVCALARRVALDSMPEARRAVLSALSAAANTGEMLTTAGCARTARLDRKVARHQLEELAAIGVVQDDREQDEADDPAGVVHWSLTGEDGALIAAVFGEHRATGGWDETWVYKSSSLPLKGETDEHNGAQTRDEPTVRPTPEAVPV